MSATLQIELYFDEEARNWHYRVLALHINGDGTASREDAERACMDAISFALEGDPNEYDSDAVMYAVSVASVAPTPHDATPSRSKKLRSTA